MMPARDFLRLPAARVTARSEEEFFSSIMVRNGTYKTTWRQRFPEVDDIVVRLLDEGAITARNVLDVAVSSGTSTLELCARLHAGGYAPSVTATDVLLDVKIIKAFPGCYAIVDETGFPLRFDVFRWSVKPWVTRNDYFNGKAIFRKSVQCVLTRRVNRLLDTRVSAGIESAKLVSPRMLADADIRIEQDDLRTFNPDFAGRFDFIRAANILNRAYFPAADLRGMIENLRRYLAGDGSGLLVLRTHEDRSNHGAIYRLTAHRGLERLIRFGKGSEVDDLVMATMDTGL